MLYKLTYASIYSTAAARIQTVLQYLENGNNPNNPDTSYGINKETGKETLLEDLFSRDYLLDLHSRFEEEVEVYIPDNKTLEDIFTSYNHLIRVYNIKFKRKISKLKSKFCDNEEKVRLLDHWEDTIGKSMAGYIQHADQYWKKQNNDTPKDKIQHSVSIINMPQVIEKLTITHGNKRKVALLFGQMLEKRWLILLDRNGQEINPGMTHLAEIISQSIAIHNTADFAENLNIKSKDHSTISKTEINTLVKDIEKTEKK